MIPFSPPNITEEAINEVVDTLRSGWITTGPKTKLFEKKLTEYCGNKATLCVNSATFGLELILRWYGVGEGDEVIIPAYTYTATASTVIHVGAKPVMVDVNSDDFNINVEAIKKAITEKTKVIIPVDFAGLPVDIDKINNLVRSDEVVKLFKANSKNQQKLGRILVMSDAAHSFGAEYQGKRVGALTDIAVFSFHAVKNLTTAEGGAIALNLPDDFDNDEVYKYLNTFSLHGQSKDALAKTKKGAWKYDIIEPAYKGNMTDIQASLGLVALKNYDTETLKKRKYIFDKYSSAFVKYQWAQIPVYQDNIRKSSCHVYALRVKNITKNQRDEIIQKIFDKDVSVNVHFQPLPLLTAYKKLGYKINDYTLSFDNYCREISLPVFDTITDEQIEVVIRTVVSSVKEIITD